MMKYIQYSEIKLLNRLVDHLAFVVAVALVVTSVFLLEFLGVPQGVVGGEEHAA